MKQTTSTVFLLLFSLTLSFGQKTPKLHYNSFTDFYNHISNKKELNFTNIPLTDTTTLNTKLTKDTIQETFTYKTAGMNIKFVSKKDTSFIPNYTSSYILFNNTKILPDSNIGFEGLSIYNAGKTILNGTTFFILPSSAPGCNGSFCRIEYDQLFQMKGNKVNYQIVTGWQSPQNIYCDLNNDGQLDLIDFTGQCFSKLESDNSTEHSEKYYFCIQARTLENNKWIAMTDKEKKPYFIYLQVDDFFEMETFKILDYNWLTEL